MNQRETAEGRANKTSQWSLWVFEKQKTTTHDGKLISHASRCIMSECICCVSRTMQWLSVRSGVKLNKAEFSGERGVKGFSIQQRLNAKRIEEIKVPTNSFMRWAVSPFARFQIELEGILVVQRINLKIKTARLHSLNKPFCDPFTSDAWMQGIDLEHWAKHEIPRWNETLVPHLSALNPNQSQSLITLWLCVTHWNTWKSSQD